jgi:hypothetical protein
MNQLIHITLMLIEKVGEVVVVVLEEAGVEVEVGAEERVLKEGDEDL